MAVIVPHHPSEAIRASMANVWSENQCALIIPLQCSGHDALLLLSGCGKSVSVRFVRNMCSCRFFDPFRPLCRIHDRYFGGKWTLVQVQRRRCDRNDARGYSSRNFQDGIFAFLSPETIAWALGGCRCVEVILLIVIQSVLDQKVDSSTNKWNALCWGTHLQCIESCESSRQRTLFTAGWVHRPKMGLRSK